MTQDQLAEKIGVQPRMILELEKGRGNPRFDNLYSMVQVLDIPPKDIFSIGRTRSNDTEKFIEELSGFSEQEQLLALAAARGVLTQFRRNREERDG